jgi:hypothetical protein
MWKYIQRRFKSFDRFISRLKSIRFIVRVIIIWLMFECVRETYHFFTALADTTEALHTVSIMIAYFSAKYLIKSLKFNVGKSLKAYFCYWSAKLSLLFLLISPVVLDDSWHILNPFVIDPQKLAQAVYFGQRVIFIEFVISILFFVLDKLNASIDKTLLQKKRKRLALAKQNAEIGATVERMLPGKVYRRKKDKPRDSGPETLN